jgi:hypothetical protein
MSYFTQIGKQKWRAIMEPLLSSGTDRIHGFRRFVDDNIPATVGGNITE